MSCGGEQSNRKLSAELEQRAVTILSDPVYRGFGPTLAAEYLHKLHEITVSKETLRQMDGQGGVVESRPTVEWWKCTSGGRGGAAVASWCSGTPAPTTGWKGAAEQIYLISMIDDATSRLFARFVRHDTSEENMRLLWAYLERYGRPLAFYTDKAGMFQVAVKTKRQEQREGRDRPADAADAD